MPYYLSTNFLPSAAVFKCYSHVCVNSEILPIQLVHVHDSQHLGSILPVEMVHAHPTHVHDIAVQMQRERTMCSMRIERKCLRINETQRVTRAQRRHVKSVSL